MFFLIFHVKYGIILEVVKYMKNIFKIAKKYKYLISINILVLLLTFMFPMKAFKAEFASGTNRIGIILEPGVTVSQKFVSKFDKIEKISVLMSTINNNIGLE